MSVNIILNAEESITEAGWEAELVKNTWKCENIALAKY